MLFSFWCRDDLDEIGQAPWAGYLFMSCCIVFRICRSSKINQSKTHRSWPIRPSSIANGSGHLFVVSMVLWHKQQTMFSISFSIQYLVTQEKKKFIEQFQHSTICFCVYLIITSDGCQFRLANWKWWHL